MSLSPIGTSYTPITSTQLQSVSAPQSSVSGFDNDSSPGTSAVGSKFAAALSQALSQLGSSATAGTSATSGTTDASATQDPQHAIAAFAQSLFSALHAQGTQQADGSASADSAGGSDGSAAVSAAHHHHHGGGGAGKLETGLQNLIQQLSAPTASPTSTATTDADSSGSDGTGVSTGSSTSTSSAANAKLQQSFTNLLAAEGVSGSSASLGSFLQSLASSLQGAPSSGNVVNTQA